MPWMAWRSFFSTSSNCCCSRRAISSRSTRSSICWALNPARFRGSDAEFNIGTAVGAVQSLPPGVYIAMNGRIWDPLKVRKNIAANRFEAAG